MTKPIATETLTALEAEIFLHHNLQSTNDDLDDMYFHFMTSEQNSDAFPRETATISFLALKRLMRCLETKQPPEQVVSIEIKLDI